MNISDIFDAIVWLAFILTIVSFYIYSFIYDFGGVDIGNFHKH